MLENLNKKQKIIVISILVFMVIVIIFYLYKTLGTLNTSDFSEENYIFEDDVEFKNETSNEIVTESEDTHEILVHISGQVKSEMVVTLPEGSRIKDAVDAAGGLKKEADLTNINLAYILEDGEKIYIPKKGEEIEDSITSSKSVETSSSITSSVASKSSKININKATQSELESIPGIGPSTALKIINYREENGKFSSIEDIKNVSGIGEVKYSKMKDYITIK